MIHFLIDENLPYYFNLWDKPNFKHVFDLEGIQSDKDIWEYAKRIIL